METETLRFGYHYFKRNMAVAVLAEIFSILGIFAELMLPLLTGILIDFCIQGGKVTEESGGAFHFLLTGKYGQPHTIIFFFIIRMTF